MQRLVLGHATGGLQPDPVAVETLALVSHHPRRVVDIAPFDRPQRVDETGHDPLVADQNFIDRRQRERFWNIRGGVAVFEATLAAGQIRHQSGGQQGVTLPGVHPPVGEPALVTQPDDMELDIDGGITAGDEMHRQRAGRQVMFQGAGGSHECLRHQLAAERPNRIFARMAADEDVVTDRVKLKDVQQFVEIGLSQ